MVPVEWEIAGNWDDVLEEIDPTRRDVYFREGYVDAYVNAGAKAECFIARSRDRVFLLPYLRVENPAFGPGRFDVSVAYGYGGPVSSHDDAAFVHDCCSRFVHAMRVRGCVMATIRYHPLLANHVGVPQDWAPTLRRHTVAIDLRPTVDEIWTGQIHPKHRNKIRQAHKNGLEFHVDRDWEHLDSFIEIYEETMHRLGADDIYLFDHEYYRRIQRGLEGRAFLAFSSLGREPLAAAIFLHDGPYGHYHLSGTTGDARRLRAGNHLVYNGALRLKEMGCSLLHLGGGVASDEGDALYEFKRRFGNVVRPYYISVLMFDGNGDGSRTSVRQHS